MVVTVGIILTCLSRAIKWYIIYWGVGPLSLVEVHNYNRSTKTKVG